MIRIDPFYVLLMMELLLIQAGLLVFLFLKWNKGGPTKEVQLVNVPYLELPASPEPAKEPPLDPPKTGEETIANPAGNGEFTFLTEEAVEKTGNEVSKESASEVERLQKTLDEKIEVILELKNKIEEMEKKFESVENEYQILFDQSQKQEEALRAYEKGRIDPKMFS